MICLDQLHDFGGYIHSQPREFRIELVCGKIRKIAYLGSVPSIFISCCFDYTKLREVIANIGDDVTAETYLVRVV